jgi:hypothetical protein
MSHSVYSNGILLEPKPIAKLIIFRFLLVMEEISFTSLIGTAILGNIMPFV